MYYLFVCLISYFLIILFREPTDLLITLEGAFIVAIFLGQKSKRNEISSIFRKLVFACTYIS